MPIFQVFEHGTIKVGDSFNGVKFTKDHLEVLKRRLGENDESSFPFYSLTRDGVKFKQYVGAIQVKDLTIEILPKTDKGGNNHGYWKSALLFMLSRVHKLNIRVSDVSPQNVQKSSILDYILLRFLDETDEILHKGLIKTYRMQDDNLYSLKGRLLIPKQITKNFIHKERFFVRHTVYDRSHIMNRIIRQTLQCIAESSMNSFIKQRANACLMFFPEMDQVTVNENLFARLEYNRKTEIYREAMSLSELILFNNMPNLSTGKRNSLAVLFDMNRLWEEFVFVSLQRYLPDKYTVVDQEEKSFWNSRNIRPDIVIRERDGKENEHTYILDTKWKQPQNNQPSDSDLHQMYVYFRYFNAEKVALLYPSSAPTKPIDGYFTESGKSCDLMFLPVPKPEDKSDTKFNGMQWQRDIKKVIEKWVLQE